MVERDSASIKRGGRATADANGLMHDAAAYIDERFGDGYALNHPELVAAFMQAAARSSAAEVLADAASALSEAIQRLADSQM